MKQRHFKKGERRFLFKLFFKKCKEKIFLCFDFPIKIIYIQGTICSVCLKLYKSPIDFDYLQFYKDRVAIFVTKKDIRNIYPSKTLKPKDSCIFLLWIIFYFSALLCCKNRFPKLLSSAVPVLVFQAYILIQQGDLLSRFL